MGPVSKRSLRNDRHRFTTPLTTYDDGVVELEWCDNGKGRNFDSAMATTANTKGRSTNKPGQDKNKQRTNTNNKTKENQDGGKRRDGRETNRPPSPGNKTVVVTPGYPLGLTPPPERYSPGTVMVTPEPPPPDAMFPAESGPKHVKNLGKPPTPSRHRRHREVPRSPRQSIKAVRDLVDSPPPTPWSDHPDNGSLMSLPRNFDQSTMSPRSVQPVQGSVVSRFTRTLVNSPDPLRTPVSSRWTYPRYNIRPPSNHTFRTFPEGFRRYDATPKPPKTGWSKLPRRGSLIAPPWSEKRLVEDPQMSETAKWVGIHGAYAAEYSSRPMWLGYDVETESDILQTPQGPRRYIGQEPEATDVARWVERNHGNHRDWLDTPYYDGRYYQYDRRYMDVDQYSDYVPERDYQPTNPILYNEKAESTSKWVNRNFDSNPIMVERERRRHRNYEPGRGHPKKLIPVYTNEESDTESRHQRYRDHRAALREKEFYRSGNPGQPRASPDSIRAKRGSDRQKVDSPEIPPDRYDRHGDDESMFTRKSVKSYSHYQPSPPQRSDPGWDRYRDYGKEMENMGPPALPGRENVHRWLSQR